LPVGNIPARWRSPPRLRRHTHLWPTASRWAGPQRRYSETVQVDPKEKALYSRAFAEPSDGLEPSTPPYHEVQRSGVGWAEVAGNGFTPRVKAHGYKCIPAPCRLEASRGATQLSIRSADQEEMSQASMQGNASATASLRDTC